MEATSTPCAYLAVTAAEAEKISAEDVLTSSVFFYSPVLNYFKLFPSSEAAVLQALKSRTLESAKAALEPTKWFILTLHLTDKQWRHLWMATEEPWLRWGPRYKAWRVYGTLDIRNVAKAWDQVTISAIGIDAWKENALGKAIIYPAGQCAECKVRDVQVFKSKNQCKKDFYCSACWHKYILGTFKAAEQQDGECEEVYIADA